MIQSIREFDRQRPLLTAALIVLLFVLYFLSPLVLGTSGQSGAEGVDSSEAASMAIPELGLVVAVLLIVSILGAWHDIYGTSAPTLRHLWVLLPVLAYLSLFWIAAYSGYSALEPNVVQSMVPLLIGIVATTALVGIFEEFLFRGLVFRGMKAAWGPVAAFFLSSLVFGAMHYVNLVNGQSFGNTTIQVLHAAGGGLLYCALMMYLNSIWPSVILHAVWDSTVFVSETFRGPTDPNEIAASTESVSLFQYAIYGFEPIFGVIVFWLWLRQRKTT